MQLLSLRQHSAYPSGHFFVLGTSRRFSSSLLFPSTSPLSSSESSAASGASSFRSCTLLGARSSGASGAPGRSMLCSLSLTAASFVDFFLPKTLPILVDLDVLSFWFNKLCSSTSSLTASNLEISILKNKLRNKVCPNRIMTMNRKADKMVGGMRVFSHSVDARMPAYMIVFQFSPVMTWKTVMKPHTNVSKCARGMQSCRKFFSLQPSSSHQTLSLCSGKAGYRLSASPKWKVVPKIDIHISVNMYSTRRKSTSQ
mmetsp:Transcript_20636/g.57475  ORF Transcript_20636/g.57475 Transcript_20636/m.57475 type:complete len:256 (+) Transcript_20636:3153-3920(+)